MWRIRSGFSLLELVVAIGILAAVAAGVVSLIGQGPRWTARDARRQSDLEKIASAVELYRNDNRTYPRCGAGSNCQASAITNGAGMPVFSTYMSVVPNDQTPRYFVYAPRPSGCRGTVASRCTTYELCAASERGGTTVTCGVGGGTNICGTGGQNCVFRVTNP